MGRLRENQAVATNSRFAFALAFCVALAVAATVGAISLSSDREALQLDELLQHQPVPAGASGSLEEHLGWTFEIFGGERRWTETELSERFTPGFNDSFDADTLNAGLDQLFADLGPVRFHRVTDRDETTIRALASGENGTPITIWLSMSDSTRIESLTLDELPSPPPLPPWKAALVIVASWSFIAAAVIAARYESQVQAWVLLAAAPVSAAAVLLLSRSRLAYTNGRVLPALAVPIVIWLLTRSTHQRGTRTILAAAAAASLLGMIAPLTRDATLISHPALYASVIDNETTYRVLQASSFAIAGAALLTVSAVAVATVKRAMRRQRAQRWSVAVLAAVWGLSASGSAIDFALGNGEWADGPLAAGALSALTVVPAVVIIGVVAARWDRPGINRLVIDLDADSAQLAPAVAAALGDPTLEVLVSPDGHQLVTETGTVIDPEDIAETRLSTEIRAGERLVGALVHDASLRHEPERLEAVAAAAGMALEVNRLNEQVTAQLDEVNASRARIVHASDTARRQVERDLHDGAQQRLVALGLRLQRARRLAQSGRSEDLVDLLDGATAEVRDTIDEIRAVSRGAQPALLAERGLAAAVDALAERAPVPVDLDITTDVLRADVESTAYFVIAEGLTNVAKHAQATKATVSVTRSNGATEIRVEDNGRGGAVRETGSGLEGLHDRVAAAGGTLVVASTSEGTTLEVILP